MTLKTLTVFGTRPEAIKLAPLINQLKRSSIDNKICTTGQHQEMLSPVLNLFNIVPDFNLGVMSANQSLSQLTAKIISNLEPVLQSLQPNLILVHGDTTTTLAASLSAYYFRIPVAHLEAGLRTGNIYSPWPEEVNRKLATVLSDIHFAPTEMSRNNLLKEGVPSEKIYITGNTVVDSLLEIDRRIKNDPKLCTTLAREFSFLKSNRQSILITGHRRENFGAGFKQICQAIRQIAIDFPEIDLVYPVHLNPNVQRPVHEILHELPNVFLINPLGYVSFIYLMQRSTLILTDSGGIQEEAPSLGKPVLLMRETTERPEAVNAGTVRLVGADTDMIVSSVKELLTDQRLYFKMSHVQNPYGDGKASKRIIQTLSKIFLRSALEV